MSSRRFSTFEGVFTPCLLSILGVIMYLRLGWVVGNVGLAKTFGIILLANAITLATTLCMSSIVTNIRIGAGGAFSIITKSLGVEVGGAIGLPLFISQAISVAFYIAGFTEVWLFIFPSHIPLAISLSLWFIILFITYLSAKLAFRIQYVIMGIIVLSLISIFWGKTVHFPLNAVTQNVNPHNFWYVFAVFFPAVTGILAGASMSGELKTPRESIPKGTLSAIGVSLVIYMMMAWIFAKKVPAAILQTNNYIAIDLGAWPALVVAGVMGATLSSALSMAVGSPRILLAISQHRIIPFSKSFKKLNHRGEPTTAIFFTFLIVLITILSSSLNQIATILTMIFLITYGMINLTVFIEQSIGIVSFRPSFRVSKWISFFGSVSCLIVMLIIDVRFCILASVIIFLAYMILLKRGVHFYSPDIRSGALVFLAEKFVQIAHRLPYYPKIWKPNVLLPITDAQNDPRIFGFARDIVYPSGRLTIIQAVSTEKDRTQAQEELGEYLLPLKQENIFLETTVVQHNNKTDACKLATQTLEGMVFPPNSLLYVYEQGDADAAEIIQRASQELGIIVLIPDNKVGFAQKKIINLWIRKESPNINLAVLAALQIERNWDGTLRLIQVVDQQEEVTDAKQYLNKLKDIMRLSDKVEIEVGVGNFMEVISKAPPADINIFGMQEQVDISGIERIAAHLPTATLFIKDSKHESALA